MTEIAEQTDMIHTKTGAQNERTHGKINPASKVYADHLKLDSPSFCVQILIEHAHFTRFYPAELLLAYRVLVFLTFCLKLLIRHACKQAFSCFATRLLRNLLLCEALFPYSMCSIQLFFL